MAKMIAFLLLLCLLGIEKTRGNFVYADFNETAGLKVRTRLLHIAFLNQQQSYKNTTV